MATRKTAIKKTSTAKKPQVKVSASVPAKKIQLKYLIPAIIVVVLVALLGVFRGQFVPATVNGDQVSRIELVRELEKKHGKTVLESLVTEKLITQEAEKRKVSVSNDEINKQVEQIEKSVKDQGESLDMLLAQQGLTRDDLIKQVMMQELLKKMIGKIEVTDKEVDDYLKQNQESIPTDAKIDELKPQIKEQLMQQKLNEKIQTFVAELQKKAKIEYLLPL